MGAQGCIGTRCVAPKLNLVVWTYMENMIFGEIPDLDQILAPLKALRDDPIMKGR